MAQSVQKVQKSVHPDTINITDKYYRALQSMKGKHPMGREGTAFSWPYKYGTRTIYGIYWKEKPKLQIII